MSSFKSKKVILFFIIILTFVIALSLFFILKNPLNNDTEKFTNSIKSQVVLFKNNFPEERINADLLILNDNSKSEKDRYEALIDIYYYFDNAYFNTGLPAIRKFAPTIDSYASKNFKNEYKKGDFYMACADYECGEATPPEIEKLLDEIKKLPIDEAWKNSIMLNIRTASHIPNDSKFNKLDKLTSYGLAISALISLENPQASASADKLRKYIKSKYNEDL